jgi:hypoxanthine phosphoribosyltransferase
MSKVIDITLEELDGLTTTLLKQMRSSCFEPDVIIFIETGARLLASCLHESTGIPTHPLKIQRSGTSSKTRISSLLGHFPVILQNFLRRAERKLNLYSSNVRRIAEAPAIDLSCKKILILDDAADSGQSLITAKKWAIDNGGDETEIKVATVAVTQPKAMEIVDFWIHNQLCRFPWSSDSRQRDEFQRLYEQVDKQKLAAGSLRF